MVGQAASAEAGLSAFCHDHRRAPAGVTTMQGEGASPHQVKAIATRPEQSSTRPVTATARKLFDANSSRMVHRLRFTPRPEGDDMFCRTVKKNPLRILAFGPGW